MRAPGREEPGARDAAHPLCHPRPAVLATLTLVAPLPRLYFTSCNTTLCAQEASIIILSPCKSNISTYRWHRGGRTRLAVARVQLLASWCPWTGWAAHRRYQTRCTTVTPHDISRDTMSNMTHKNTARLTQHTRALLDEGNVNIHAIREGSRFLSRGYAVGTFQQWWSTLVW